MNPQAIFKIEKNSNFRFIVILVLLAVSQVTLANPFLVAGKIRARPDMEDLGPMGELAEAIIDGAEGIVEMSAKVGRPSVKLSVLIIEPRDYGFEVVGTTEKGKNGEGTFKFAINVSFEDIENGGIGRILSPERQKELKEKGEVPFKEMIALMKWNAREGGTVVESKAKSIFFLNGFGVSNRTTVLWALVLAKNGYQVIVPDLRGIGKSGGKGPTYGKREVQDLMDLLSQLQSKGEIKRENAVGVMGVSYGAGMASLWTARDQRITATVLVAPYARADETLMSAAETLMDQLDLPFEINPESVRKGTELAAKLMRISWEDLAPEKAIPTIGHPIHFVTSPSDEIIPSSVVKKLHKSAAKGSTLRTVNVPHMYLGLYLEELEPDILSYFERTLR